MLLNHDPDLYPDSPRPNHNDNLSMNLSKNLNLNLNDIKKHQTVMNESLRSQRAARFRNKTSATRFFCKFFIISIQSNSIQLKPMNE